MPGTVATDTRWLERHGQIRRVTVSVPQDLRKVLGTCLKRSLRTDGLAVANRLKLQAVSELQGLIEKARETKAGVLREVIQEAIEISRYAQRAGGEDETRDPRYCISERAEKILGAPIRVAYDEEAGEYPVYDPKREALAKDFTAVAWGAAEPLMLHHDDDLSKSKVEPRTSLAATTSARTPSQRPRLVRVCAFRFKASITAPPPSASASSASSAWSCLPHCPRGRGLQPSRSCALRECDEKGHAGSCHVATAGAGGQDAVSPRKA